MDTVATEQDDQEAKPEKCAQLAQLLIQSKLIPQLVSGLAALPFEARKQFAQVFNNLMRRDLAGFVGYVERNAELLSTLVAGYEDPDIALNCGTMLREVRAFWHARRSARRDVFGYQLLCGRCVASRSATSCWRPRSCTRRISGSSSTSTCTCPTSRSVRTRSRRSRTCSRATSRWRRSS